ncbi:hypothetical protein HSX11_06020 [Oxalobacteraceae bacterium]|nr:hypothetical protein [Oxalobacteraceae bacterium]
MGWFTSRRRPPADTGALGSHVIAQQLDDGDVAPAACKVVVFNAAGYARRAQSGKVAREEGETAWCFHPGSYSVDLTPFAAAPELGLRLRFVVDAADPRVAQQRFDLFLHSEAEAPLTVPAFRIGVEDALQSALDDGVLDLPPCTALAEWHAFRAGLNQLLYVRFGVTVEDCVPVDLGEQVDFAAMLRQRAAVLESANAVPSVQQSGGVRQGADPSGLGVPVTPALVPGLPRQAPAPDPDSNDARALRRLFLELPAATSALRLIVLPPGQTLFQSQQQLLQRLGLASLAVTTMPSLAWAAPGQPLASADQTRRAAASIAAVHALDQGWALIARLQLAQPDDLAPLLDEADRIVANLEHSLAQRRAAAIHGEPKP